MRTLIKNAHILTVNPDYDEYKSGWLTLDGGVISGLGGGECPAPASAFDAIIDADGDVIMPGMVNTHCHMSMTLFRGLGEDVDDRLFRYILPLEREAVTRKIVRTGAALAALEMLLGGVTTTADMYYFEQEVGRVLDVAGMRGVVGQTLADFDAPDHKSFDEGFALVDALRDEFKDHDRITASIAPHAPYSTGPAIMERVAQYASDHPEMRIQMHLAEMKSEMAWCAKNHDCRPVELADRSGILQPGAIMAHCLELNSDEIDVLSKRGITVAHSPRSNAKAGRGIAHIEAMRENGIAVGLATDGPMSGNTLDIFAQMAPASMFAKLLGSSRGCLPAGDVVKMATLEGAKVLGLDEKTGSLEVGKCADLIRISTRAPRMKPIYDIYAALVFSANASDIRDVMIHGKWVVQDRAVLTLDQSKVMSDAEQAAGQFRQVIDRIDAAKTS